MEANGLGIGGVGGSVDDDGLFGGGDVGVGGFSQVGEEDVMPEGGAGGGADVLDVEDAVFEFFVEDAGLDFEGGLGGLEGFAQRNEAGGGAGCEIERVEQAEGQCEGGDDGDDANEVDGSDAGGAHGGDFAVGGKTRETEEDADENGHGDGDGESRREGIEDDAGDIGVGGGVADNEFENFAEVASKDDEGEECSAEKGVRGDFAEDVAGENAHFFAAL